MQQQTQVLQVGVVQRSPALLQRVGRHPTLGNTGGCYVALECLRRVLSRHKLRCPPHVKMEGVLSGFRVLQAGRSEEVMRMPWAHTLRPHTW